MLTADIWGPIGAALAILAIVVGAILAWWFARGPQLVMQVSGSTLVSTPSDHRVTVLYKDLAVPRVTQSLVWIWREGRGTIKGADIVSADPVVLHVPKGDQVLDAAVLAQSRDTNGVCVAVEPGERPSGVKVSFDYLDARQGAVIEILHTGEAPDTIEPTGTVMGVPKGIVRVTTGVKVQVPTGLLGSSMEVTVPTHAIPRDLRTASGAHTERDIDLTPVGALKTFLRILLP